MEWTYYAAGDVCPAWATRDNYIQIEYLCPCWQFVVGFPAITEQEVKAITADPIDVGFAVVDDVIFFLLRYGNGLWCDAPYEPRLEKTPKDYPADLPEGKGAPMLLCAADTNTGQLREMRLISLGHDMTERLHRACLERLGRPGFHPADHDRKVDRIYQRFVSSEQLARCVAPEDMVHIE